MTLEVDARDVVQGFQHSHLTIPVHAGPLTLAYPKWIPGHHAAVGPVTQMMALRLTGAGASLKWRRDSRDPFSFHVTVPYGVEVLDVYLDYVSPPKRFGDGFGRTPNVTPHLLVLPFNHFILYPQNGTVERMGIKASVLIPAGWQYDCALRPERSAGGNISLPLVSVSTLVDSPLLAGEYFRSIPIASGDGATRISLAADAPGDLAVDDATIGGLRRLVDEAAMLFGQRHYREYVWLVALGNTLSMNGLEHYESTDIRDVETLFTDSAHLLESRVIPHEYVHSWNGKYRRPEGLATHNFQEPMRDDLLWVYEGMTRYLGDLVLRARSGLVSQDQSREYIAWIAALMDQDRPGRSWRSVADTATALPAYHDAPGEWGSMRRKLDYYDEMLLVWLEADVKIREATNGTRSLDDFCGAFFGGPDRAPTFRPYSRADLVNALDKVALLNWGDFLTARVDTISPRAPLEGVRRAGWSLVYDDTPNAFLTAREKVDEMVNLSLSLGMWVQPDGTVADVVQGSPAFAEGFAPMMRVLAIGGYKWSVDAARSAVIRAESRPGPIELVVERGDIVKTMHIDYHEGLRIPHLVRNSSKPDLLSKVLAPHKLFASSNVQ